MVFGTCADCILGPIAERIRQDLEQSAVQLSEGEVGQLLRTF